MKFVEEGKVNCFASVRKDCPAVSWRSTHYLCRGAEIWNLAAEGSLISCPSVFPKVLASLSSAIQTSLFASTYGNFLDFLDRLSENSLAACIFWLLGLSELSQGCLAGVLSWHWRGVQLWREKPEAVYFSGASLAEIMEERAWLESPGVKSWKQRDEKQAEWATTVEAGEFGSRRTEKEQAAGWELWEQEGLGWAKRSQGRGEEAWGALEQQQCGGSCGLEGMEQRHCKAGSQPWTTTHSPVLERQEGSPDPTTTTSPIQQGAGKHTRRMSSLPSATHCLTKLVTHYEQNLHGQQWTWNRSQMCGSQHGPT